MKVRDKSDLSVSSCMLLKAMGRSPIVRDLYSHSTIWAPRCAQTAPSILSERQRLLRYHYLSETVCSDSLRDLCHFIGRYIWEDPATFMVSLDRNSNESGKYIYCWKDFKSKKFKEIPKVFFGDSGEIIIALNRFINFVIVNDNEQQENHQV